MKKNLSLIFLFITLLSLSQQKFGKSFITGTFNFTLGINENYTINNEEGEYLIEPAAIFLRTGFGYEFKKRVAISFNAGFDYHWNYAVSAFPTYGTIKYNITEDEGDTFFIEGSYGKMWRPSSNYPDGKYYSFGIGSQVAGGDRWNTILRLDFHRKSIYGFENNRLDSVSLGIGFSFF